MSAAELEPIWVGDSSHPDWDRIFGGQFWVDAVTWLRSEGFDADNVTRVEVFLLDAPFAKVWEFVLDENGAVQLNKADDGPLTVIRTVMLSSLPPPWPDHP